MTDVEYGVFVSNKYSLFYDEDHDPNEIIAQQMTLASTKKTAEEKAAKKKEKKAAASQPISAPTAGIEKKTSSNQPQTKSGASESTPRPGGQGGQRQAARGDREEKENKPARPFGGGENRGGGRPPRGDRPPRQDRSNLPPRMGGGGFNSDTGGEHQQFDHGFQQGEDRGGFGGRGRGRGRGRGGFGGRGRGGRGGFNQGDDTSGGGGGGGGGGFGFNAYDSNQGNQGFGGGNESGGFGTFGADESAGGGGGGGGGFGGGFGGGSDRPYRGRGRGRGRGGRGFGGGRGRQFDRVSGSDKTGVKPVDKREGSGPYNWGSERDEAAAGNEVLNTTGEGEIPAPVEGGEHEKTRASGDEEHQEGDEAAAAKEAEENMQKELTLDEWKALQAPKSKPQFNIRRPGEGEGDKNEWKGLKPLTKVAEPKKGHDESGEDESEDAHQKKKAKEVPIEINFIDNSGGFARGTRGGGRGGRGGRGRGGPRGGGGGPSGDERGGERGGGFDGGAERPFRGRGGGRGGGGFGGFGGGGSSGRGGGGRRDVPYKMDEESFPQLSSSAAA